jgi:hypothetical protein
MVYSDVHGSEIHAFGLRDQDWVVHAVQPPPASEGGDSRPGAAGAAGEAAPPQADGARRKAERSGQARVGGVLLHHLAADEDPPRAEGRNVLGHKAEGKLGAGGGGGGKHMTARAHGKALGRTSTRRREEGRADSVGTHNPERGARRRLPSITCGVLFSIDGALINYLT